MMEDYTVEVKVPTIQIIVKFEWADDFKQRVIEDIARKELVERGNKIGVLMDVSFQNYDKITVTFEYLG